MRETNWLVRVLQEATERVDGWPNWKKAADLQSQDNSEKGKNEQSEPPDTEVKCA